MSRDCEIRFIITVNALKEGWDCPFAYILATVANRNSAVDVEQILGRVLRLPYTKANKHHQVLNLSYVITSSTDFYGTLDKVVAGLNNAGFSNKDYRMKNMEEESVNEAEQSVQMNMGDYMTNNQGAEEQAFEELTDEDIPVINTEKLVARLGKLSNLESAENAVETNIQIKDTVDSMIGTAMYENMVYWETIDNEESEQFSHIPEEVISRMKVYHVKEEFREDIKGLKLPQFVIENGYGLFSDQIYELVDRENLRKNFTLTDKDTKVDFSSVDAEIAKVDVDENGETPKAWKLRGFESEAIKEWFDSRPTESKRRLCLDKICKKLSKNNAIDDSEIKDYVNRIMSQMTETQLTELEQMPDLYAAKIKEKVDALLAEYESEVFHKWLEQDYIQCQPMYELTESITPVKTISSIPKSLYEEEDGNLNDYERKVIWELSGLDNVKWWHRNISRKEFAINGAVTAYPDLMVMLENGKMLLVETKGDHLDNDESEAKAKTGAEWAALAGKMYKYYMVFETKNPGYRGAFSHDKFMEIVKGL